MDLEVDTGEKQQAASHHQCTQCAKSYARREHLRRHMASHKQERPYQCVFCGVTFKRADVLSRHVRSCVIKLHRPSKPSTRRRACNRCVQRKSACDRKLPCDSCKKRDVECSYSASETDPARPASSTSTGATTNTTEELPASFEPFQAEIFGFPNCDWFDYWTSNWQQLANITPEYRSRSNPLTENDISYSSLSFLDKFTSNTGFIISFDCGTELERMQVALNMGSSEGLGQIHDHQCFSESNGYSTNHTALNMPTQPFITSEQDDMNLSSTWLSDPLALKTHDIQLLIKEVVTIKTRGSAVTLDWSSTVKDMCLSFFCPQNLRKYLEFYWAIWHPNVNFVHRPTFDPATAKSILLAAMVLIGASVSPDEEDNENAKIWFNCVEEMVFMDEDFSNDMDGMVASNNLTTTASRHKIQALQAAYMVVLYQNWEGTDSSKSRIRRYRYATLVSASRDLNIPMARHINYHTLGRHDFKWLEFSTREELIRTFLWIFLLDTGFTIFNNLPPRMVIREMGMHMAMPESCFQAPTADSCFEAIQQYVPSNSSYWKTTLASAFRNLCDPNYSSKISHVEPSVGPLNLFALASAIHSLIFQCQNFFVDDQSLIPVQNAINNWKADWHCYITHFSGAPHVLVSNTNLQPSTMWKRVGFCRYTPEFWLLASFKLDRITKTKEATYVRNGHDISQHSPVGSYTEPLNDGIDDPILNEYDQTSMRQVNDLISDFQKVHLL